MSEDQEKMMIELVAEQSNYAETEESIRGLPDFVTAKSLSDLMERDVKQDEDRILRINEREDGLFDLIVLKRVN